VNLETSQLPKLTIKVRVILAQERPSKNFAIDDGVAKSHSYFELNYICWDGKRLRVLIFCNQMFSQYSSEGHVLKIFISWHRNQHNSSYVSFQRFHNDLLHSSNFISNQSIKKFGSIHETVDAHTVFYYDFF
jgi:hypothetical protein